MMNIFVSNKIPNEMLAPLAALGCSPILLPACPRLPAPVSSHADMLVLRLGERFFVEGEYYSENAELFDGLSVVPTAMLSPEYPHDVSLNALCLRGILYCRAASLAPEVRGTAHRIVNVRQGYARCSTLVTADGCALTSDPSLAAAFCENKVEYLLITPGHIILPGYDYGFIGGASGLLSDGRVALFGSLRHHPEGERIARFLDSHGGCVELADTPLYDVGGFVAI